MSRLVVIDFETTGFVTKDTSMDLDEILQVAIIDETCAVLMNQLCCPRANTSWPQAQRVHHISPQDVAGKPAFEEIADQVAAILSEADFVMAYNETFEKKFLARYGIDPDQFRWAPDPMVEFRSLGISSSCKLTVAAGFFNFAYKAHDALEDVIATLYVANKIAECKAHGILSVLTDKSIFVPVPPSALVHPSPLAAGGYYTLPPAEMLNFRRYLGLQPFADKKPVQLYYKQPIQYDTPIAEDWQPCTLFGYENLSKDGQSAVLVLGVNGNLIKIDAAFYSEMWTKYRLQNGFDDGATNPLPERKPRKSPAQKPAKHGLVYPAIIFADCAVTIEGNRFCLTGDLAEVKREEISEKIKAAGGTASTSVSPKVDYLAVGKYTEKMLAKLPDGKPSKVREAEELQRNGGKIKIIELEKLWKMVK